MSKQVSIIVGSVLGATEYVADALKEYLESKDYSCRIFLEPELETLSDGSHWLICSSTHGAGDLPDNIQPFANQLKTADLQGVNATIIGLGDTSYDTFCQGAMTLEKYLLDAGATISHEPLHIDVLQHPIPEDKAVEWIMNKF